MTCPDPAGNLACINIYNGECLWIVDNKCELRKRPRRSTHKPKDGTEIKSDHFVDVNKMVEGEK